MFDTDVGSPTDITAIQEMWVLCDNLKQVCTESHLINPANIAKALVLQLRQTLNYRPVLDLSQCVPIMKLNPIEIRHRDTTSVF